MGDRGLIAVKQEYYDDLYVYIYTHWGGACIRQDVASALTRGRWDGSYLTRNILDALEGRDLHSPIGFGVSAGPWADHDHGEEYPVVIVDPKEKTVAVLGREWTFEEWARGGWVDASDYE